MRSRLIRQLRLESREASFEVEIQQPGHRGVLEEADLVASAILCLESCKTLRAPALRMSMAVEDKQDMSNGN